MTNDKEQSLETNMLDYLGNKQSILRDIYNLNPLYIKAYMLYLEHSL